MKSIEDAAINIGINQDLLMENAGIAVYSVLKKEFFIYLDNWYLKKDL